MSNATKRPRFYVVESASPSFKPGTLCAIGIVEVSPEFEGKVSTLRLRALPEGVRLVQEWEGLRFAAGYRSKYVKTRSEAIHIARDLNDRAKETAKDGGGRRGALVRKLREERESGKRLTVAGTLRAVILDGNRTDDEILEDACAILGVESIHRHTMHAIRSGLRTANKLPKRSETQRRPRTSERKVLEGKLRRFLDVPSEAKRKVLEDAIAAYVANS